jgi:hypothetical protein
MSVFKTIIFSRTDGGLSHTSGSTGQGWLMAHYSQVKIRSREGRRSRQTSPFVLFISPEAADMIAKATILRPFPQGRTE